MTSNVVAAYLLPGNPLLQLAPDTRPWAPLIDGLGQARTSLEAAAPDTVVVYSTGWVAVVDQLWLTRADMSGRFVDQTWHELGSVDWKLRVDTELAERCVPATSEFDVRSRGVDYDNFPIDPGTIVFSAAMNTADRPLVVTSNNLYHDWDITQKLAGVAVTQAAELGRKVAVVGIGGLSGSIFREGIDFADDRIFSEEDDLANKKLLSLLESGSVDEVAAFVPEYASSARAEMGMKHLAFVLGALGGSYRSARTLGYGPQNGAGAAVVEFTP